MSNELRFDGKVAIVTGSGHGLGRSHALLLASRGAKVVINDLGGNRAGGGKSSEAADAVVAEIEEAGGEAVANYDSVEDGEAIVKTALDTWGRVDIVVNNAGILRDKSFHNMSEEDWNLVYRVHLYGSMKVTRAAWPVMREQGYGRVIMTTSSAGLYGNFGQANYSAAKLGIVGLANTLAVEGQRKGILVNVIAPFAASRLTEDVLPKHVFDAIKPEYVSPLVAYLAHEGCDETGAVFEVGGGFFGKLRRERAKGKMFRVGRNITPEDVQRGWDEITSFDEGAEHPGNIMESMSAIVQNVDEGPSKGGNEFIDVDLALGAELPEIQTSYDERDLALYALGVGAAQDPNDENDLRYVYEMHSGGMRPLPTYAVIPATNASLTLAKQGKQAPGLNYGLDRLLHGEQYTELMRPLPLHAKLTHKTRIKDIFDKGKGAIVVTEVNSYDEDGELLIKNELTAFIRGAGGWGGDRGPSASVNEPPDRAPDATAEDTIPDNQALLYRLSGDWNPLHADPSFAKAFGFERPILHGLCTFGYAGRRVLENFAPDHNPDFFKSIKVRFADNVFPGETLVTEMWKDGDRRVVFRCKIKERDSVVISNAAIELFDEIPKPKAKKPAAAEGGAPKVDTSPISQDVFRAIEGYVEQHPEVVDKAKTSFLFRLANPESTWTVDLENAPGSVTHGVNGKPDVTFDLSEADFMDLYMGKSDPMKLFSSGKLKISGDMMKSQKLQALEGLTPDLIQKETERRIAAGGAAGQDTATGGEAAQEPGSFDLFAALEHYVGGHPELVGQVGHVFLFKLSDPESAWTVDLKNGQGDVIEGAVEKPDCTIEATEGDFMDMATGKADPMKLFTQGKLRISGNVMASQKLDFLQKIDPDDPGVQEAVAKARAERAAGGGGAAAAAPAAIREAQAPKIFEALGKRLAEASQLADEVQAVVKFVVTEPDATFVVDLASKPPKMLEGGSGQPTATLTISDDDLAALVKGETSAQDLYQHGKLRADGDVMVAHRLGFLKNLI